MNVASRLSVSLAILLACFASEAAAELTGERFEGNATAIVGVTVIDVERGVAIPDRTVIVRYGKIDDIEPAETYGKPPGWMTVLDGRGRYLIPGLWDAHVHLSFWDEPDGPATSGREAVDNDYRDVLGRLVAWGVTSVRDMGGDLKAIDTWRERVDLGRAVGPTILRAGPYVDGPKDNDKFRRFVTTPAEAKALTRELANARVDFVKIHSQVPPDALPALFRQARRQRLPVAGHVPYGASLEQLASLGMQSVEHADAPFISYLGSRQGTFEQWQAAYQFYRAPEGEAVWDAMVAQGVAFTPTLAVFDTGWDGVGEPWSALRQWYRELPKRAHDRGVTLLAGSDLARRTGAVQPGESLHDELEVFVAIGLEPAEALRAATSSPARILGRERGAGTIRVGGAADLVLLNGNPLSDIRATRRIEAVLVRGRVLNRDRLGALRGPTPNP